MGMGFGSMARSRGGKKGGDGAAGAGECGRRGGFITKDTKDSQRTRRDPGPVKRSRANGPQSTNAGLGPAEASRALGPFVFFVPPLCPL